MDHEYYMKHALSLAKKAWGETHPNPMVGALVVEDHQILAEGWHRKAGLAHAEPEALNQLKDRDLSKATLYVTLEPCSSHGKTPPCVDLILERKPACVVIGTLDPNPLHAGKAIPMLEAAGIEVIQGVLEAECRDLNLIFNHWIVKQTPLIAGKMATTLDGKVATRTGDSKWITNAESRLNVHEWRRYFPAIVVGSGTTQHDNPMLTARLPGEEEWCPIRFIFDRSGVTANDPDLHVYSDEYKDRTIIITSKEKPGFTCWVIEAEDESAFFHAFRERCKAEGIMGVYVEGGPIIMGGFLIHKELDYLFSYRAPKIIGDLMATSAVDGLQPDLIDDSIHLCDVQHGTFGDDQLLRGFVKYGA